MIITIVQSGNKKQSDLNAMYDMEYHFGVSIVPRTYTVKIPSGEISRDCWSMEPKYTTSFKLELILEKKMAWNYPPVIIDEIPF